ncbi:MAG: hypothetical protein ACRDRG_05775, partial [Pseudonocardiaceae bacterium]
TGPILDPDALSRRAQNLAEQVKKKISTPQEGLDRPRSFRDDLLFRVRGHDQARRRPGVLPLGCAGPSACSGALIDTHQPATTPS